MADEGRDEDGKFNSGWKGGPGRPPNKYSLTAILRAHGEDIAEGEDARLGPITNAEALGIKMWKWAFGGDKTIAIHIFDRLDGKARERIQVSGDPEQNPIYLMLRKLTEESKDAK